MDSDVRVEDWATAGDDELHLELLRTYGNVVDIDPYSASVASNGENISDGHAVDDFEEDDPFAELRSDIATWDDAQMLAHLQTVAAEESNGASTIVECSTRPDGADKGEKPQVEEKINQASLASVQEQLDVMEDDELEIEIEMDGEALLDEKEEANAKLRGEQGNDGGAQRGVKRARGTDSDDRASAPDRKVSRHKDHGDRATVRPVNTELGIPKVSQNLRPALSGICPSSTPSRCFNPEEIELDEVAMLLLDNACPSPEIEFEAAPDGNPDEIDLHADDTAPIASPRSPTIEDFLLRTLLTGNENAQSSSAIAPLLEAIHEGDDLDLSDSVDSVASPITPTSEDESLDGDLELGDCDLSQVNGDTLRNSVAEGLVLETGAPAVDAMGPAREPALDAAHEEEEDELEFDQEIELSTDEGDEDPPPVSVPAQAETRVGVDDAHERSGGKDAAVAAAQEEDVEEWELEIDDTLEMELDVDDDVEEVVQVVDADDDAVVAATEEDAIEDACDDFVATAFDGYELSDDDMPSPRTASMVSTVDDDRISLASHDLSVEEPLPAASPQSRSPTPPFPSPVRSPRRRQRSRTPPSPSERSEEKESSRKRERSASSASSESGSGSGSDSATESITRHRLDSRERTRNRERVSSIVPDVDREKEVLSPKSKLRQWLQQTCPNYEENVRELFSSLRLVEKQVAPPRPKLSFALKSGSLRPGVGKELSDAGFQSATSLAASSVALPKKEIKRAVARSRPLELLRKYTIEADIPSFLQGSVLFFRDGIMYPGKTLLPLTDGESKTCITLAQLWMLATLGESYKEKGSKLFHEYGIKRLQDEAVDPLLAYLTGATDICIFASSAVIEKPPMPIPSYQARQASGFRVSEPSAPRVPKAPCDSASRFARAPPLPPRRKEKDDDTPMPYSKSKARSKADQAQRAEGEVKFNEFLRDEFETMVEISKLSLQLEATRKRRMSLMKAFGGAKPAAPASPTPKSALRKASKMASATGTKLRETSKEPIHA
eukprot:GEMP01006372.1.p1 GENE.GEMP01006372.1~~GEMP01006372.1.p1  ORF type:complete len:1010 (+),score=366.43 GEMP01006372.1:50-3079(+)